jgi:hypothetical protein
MQNVQATLLANPWIQKQRWLDGKTPPGFPSVEGKKHQNPGSVIALRPRCMEGVPQLAGNIQQPYG